MSQRMYLFWAVLVAVVLGGVLVLGLHGMGSADGCRSASGTKHKVVISGDKVKPASTVQAKLCDQFVITNQDPEAREIAFGPHERHVPYDGVAERVLNKNQSLTITFDKVGTYHWHDHEHDEVGGYFTVTK